MSAKIVWLVTARSDLRRFLETFLTSNGYQVRPFDDGPGVLEGLGRGELPDLLLSEDPPPGLTRATIEGQLRQIAPFVRCLFLRDADDERQPDELRRFSTDDFTLSAPEVLELIESLTSEIDRELTPLPGSVLTVDVKKSLMRTVTTFVELLERYEFLNGGNGPFVQRYATEVARELGLSDSRVEAISAASLLYDVGMMRVRPEVKLKTTPLTEEELTIIRKHPRHSAEFCQSLRLPWDLSRYVLHHHERFDGQGYPDGLSGTKIPIGARILAVGDAYFAMIAKRANREPRTEEQALAELSRQAGTQFDPEIVEIWSSLIQVRFLGEGDSGGLRQLKRIALVDDDRELELMLEARFSKLGYTIISVNDPGHALPQLVEAAPEAIIIRADLPGLDPFQLLHNVRQHPRLGGMPVVMVSGGSTGATDHGRALNSGADDFVVLPCPLQELIARVNRAIRKKSRLTGEHFVRPALAAAGIRGRLTDMGLVEICQLLAQGAKTAKVSINDAGTGGFLYFNGGKLIHAESEGREGTEAFYSLLRLEEGDFGIEHGIRAPKETITERLEFLLMEGMRLLDEQAREAQEQGQGQGQGLES